ncbi:alpha-1,6-mannosyltransferase subunit [Lentinula aff. detonsa]|uniref:Mannosyltransferase n=1 Tax=Lentinula aff. detonsa TaxID=2804958 RepID=A0AA38NJP1_9AGAR|nr:alpha-1,6-mannosyltransferase subunit [Lentinula aff. detonsa]
MSLALDALIVLTGCIHVLLAPYSKVEESFNLHAVHDVLMYGIRKLDQYDHFVFPGAVPRTFIGSVALAWTSYPIILLLNSCGFVLSKFDLQVIVRLVLTTFNAFGLCFLRRAVSRRFGRPTSFYFTIITISQFLVPFWMGRTLPNMFALVPVNVASGLLLSRPPNSPKPSPENVYTAIAMLTFTAVIFRAELVLLLGPLVLQSLLLRHVSFSGVVKVALVAGLASIVTTTAIDSYFWKTTVWPEFSGMYFNVVQGKSSEWGTSPPWTYFTLLLPKLLLFALPFSYFGFLMDPRIREALLPHVAFISLISLLGHKEWRFIVYVVPVFNVAAARAGRWMVSQRKSTLIGRLSFFAFCLMLLINAVGTMMFAMASIANYPGGVALKRFNDVHPPSLVPHGKVYHVHISNLAAQTGASLFLQEHAPPFPSTSLLSHTTSKNDTSKYPWTVYDKTENLTIDELSGSRDITHLITEWSPVEMRSRMRIWRIIDVDADAHMTSLDGAAVPVGSGTVGVINGSAGWKINWDMIGAVKALRLQEFGRLISESKWRDILWLSEKPMLWIYERR